MTLVAHQGGNPLPWKFEQLLTMRQLGEYLQKSSEAARKWARRSALPMRKVGREWRVDKRDVDKRMADDARRALRQVG